MLSGTAHTPRSAALRAVDLPLKGGGDIAAQSCDAFRNRSASSSPAGWRAAWAAATRRASGSAARPSWSACWRGSRRNAARVILNANGDPARFADTGLPVVADSCRISPARSPASWPGSTGRRRMRRMSPTSSACRATARSCRADLVARAAAARDAQDKPLACARSGEWRHPVVGLWPVALRDDLRTALIEEGLRKIEVWTARHGVAIADWPTAPVDPFFNVNTPEDAAAAERIAALALRRLKPYPGLEPGRIQNLRIRTIPDRQCSASRCAEVQESVGLSSPPAPHTTEPDGRARLDRGGVFGSSTSPSVSVSEVMTPAPSCGCLTASIAPSAAAPQRDPHIFAPALLLPVGEGGAHRQRDQRLGLARRRAAAAAGAPRARR